MRISINKKVNSLSTAGGSKPLLIRIFCWKSKNHTRKE